MSALSIAASGSAVARQRLQVSPGNVANISDSGPLPNANASSAAAPAAYVPLRVDQVSLAGGGTAAATSPASPSYVTRYDPAARPADKNGLVAAPNVDLANEAVQQQIIASYASAANARAIQGGSNTIRALLDVKI